jgi:hypothetical protein
MGSSSRFGRAALAGIIVRPEAEPELRAQLGRAAARRARDSRAKSIAGQMVLAYDVARRDADRHLRFARHRSMAVTPSA